MELEASTPSSCRRCGDFVSKLERVCKSCRKSERSQALADRGFVGQLRRWRRESPNRAALFFLLFIPTETISVVRILSRLDHLTVFAIGDSLVQFVMASVLAFLVAVAPLVLGDAIAAVLGWGYRRVLKRAVPRRRAVAVELAAVSESS
jgi:high-affinity K+ transport system ATPase subunit B